MPERARMEVLIRELAGHGHRYHVLDDPLVSDAEFDRLFRELLELEKQHPEWVNPRSPTQRVGADPVKTLAPAEHVIPMLSLDNAADEEEVRVANVLAQALMKDFRGKWVVRFLILLPWVAPISLGSIGWLWMFDSIYSVINWTLQAVGFLDYNTRIMWLGKPALAMASVITVHVWRLLPLATVILIAGLSSVPQDIHDAAAVDGAGFWRHHFQITIPLVAPIMTVAVLFGFVFAFTDMIVIYVLTRGGPYNSTQVLASLAFFTGIDGGDLAEGAAISLFLFPLLVAAAFAFLRLARRAEVT